MTKKNSINNSSKYKSITSTIIMKIIHHNNHNNYVNDSNSKNILDIAIISWLLLIFNQHVSSGLGKSVKVCGMYINTLCVCVYALPPVGFFRLHDICDIREKFGSTIFSCEHFLGASAKFLHLYLQIYLISPPKTKTPAVLLLERKRYDIMCSAKR